jgi:hypothetical protein
MSPSFQIIEDRFRTRLPQRDTRVGRFGRRMISRDALKYFNQSGFAIRRCLSPALPASTDLLLTALGVVWFFQTLGTVILLL